MYGTKGVSSEPYQRYVICKTFGWDFYIYESQPTWFIEELAIIMNQEAQKENKEVNKVKRSSKAIPKMSKRR